MRAMIGYALLLLALGLAIGTVLSLGYATGWQW